MRDSESNLKTWLGLTVVTFLMLIVILLGLPALFLIFSVPSFAIGEGSFWVLRWQNDATGFRIQFNIIPLLIISLFVGVVGLWRKRKRDRNRSPHSVNLHEDHPFDSTTSQRNNRGS